MFRCFTGVPSGYFVCAPMSTPKLSTQATEEFLRTRAQRTLVKGRETDCVSFVCVACSTAARPFLAVTLHHAPALYKCLVGVRACQHRDQVCFRDLTVGIYGPAAPTTLARMVTPCFHTALVRAYADFVIRSAVGGVAGRG